jgi:hypothetical protein
MWPQPRMVPQGCFCSGDSEAVVDSEAEKGVSEGLGLGKREKDNLFMLA